MGRPKKFSRDAVLEKAIPLFWEQGFADTSLQDLEQATQVNKSGLYSEFKDKEDIFLASLRHYFDNRGGKKILATEPLGWENIENFLKISQVCMWGKTGCFAVNSTRELAVLPPEALEIVQNNRAQLKALLVRNIDAEQASIEAERIAELVFTFFTGLCLDQNVPLVGDTASQKIEDFMSLIRSF